MGNRLDEAAQDFSATIRLHPEYPNAWFNRAEVFMRQGKTDLAVENYSQAITLNAEDAGFYAGRGKAYRVLGKFALAEADLNRAIVLDNRLTKAYLQRGDLWLALGEYESAAADYRTAVRNDSQSVAAFRCVAWMMATCEDQKYRDPNGRSRWQQAKPQAVKCTISKSDCNNMRSRLPTVRK
jgi:tetratricopeptide (TPR) repeat protein